MARRPVPSRALCGALLACGLLAAPTAAGPLDPPALVVSGSGPAVATFTLRAPVRLDLYRAEVTSMAGSYGGVFIRSATSTATYGGVVRIRALNTSMYPEGTPGSRQSHDILDGHYGPQPTLPAGKYQAYLLADGAAEVRIPLMEGSALALRATAPSRQRLHTELHDLPADTDPDVDTFGRTYPFSRPVKAFSFLFGQFTARIDSEDVSVELCLASTPPKCNARVVNEAGGLMHQATASVSTKLWPEKWSAGRWQLSVTVKSTISGGGRAALAYLQLDI